MGGGAIHMEGLAQSYLEYSLFQQNNAVRGGGGALTLIASTLNFRDVEFTNNSAFLNGGAVQIYTSKLIVELIGSNLIMIILMKLQAILQGFVLNLTTLTFMLTMKLNYLIVNYTYFFI